MTLNREHGDAAIKIICAVIPAIGVYFASSNQSIAIVVSVVSAAGVFLGFRLVSKITVPEAYALGYFSSFLEPGVYAAGHEGVIGYQDKDGKPVAQSLKTAEVKFLIVLPEVLDMGGPTTTTSFSETLKRIQQSCVPGTLSVAPEAEKPFGVYVEAAKANELSVVDVPNNLRALTLFALREFGEARDRDARAAKALAEYASQLKKMIPELRVRSNTRITILQAREFFAGKRE